MIEKDDLKKLIDVASGRKKADLVLKNGNIVDRITGYTPKEKLNQILDQYTD